MARRTTRVLWLLAASACASPDPSGSDAAVDAGMARDVVDRCGTDVEPAGVVWEDCHDRYRCATIEVPIDHASPTGPRIGIRILRIPATCPASRVGVLTFNPGGPGNPGIASGIVALPVLQTLAPDIRRYFDVVMFDPRGIGESSPLDCVGDAWLANFRQTVPLAPATDPEWAALDASLAELAAGCAAAAPAGLLEHMSTEDVARDMEAIRARLGYDAWDYFGVSYGTVVGSTYATLFPTRVRAFVLDSAMLLDTDVFATYRHPALAYEAELQRFFDACGADAACAYHGGEGAAAVAAGYDALMATIAAGATTSGGRTVGTRDLGAAATAAIRAGDTARLAALLDAAEAGDATLLMEAADEMFVLSGSSAYPDWFEAFVAVVLADNACPPGFDLAALRARWDAARTAAPRLGLFIEMVHGMGCLHWPAPRSRPPLSIAAPTAPPLLVLGGRHDAATPLARGQALRDALSNGSHFIAFEGAGHGYIGLSACARDAELAFLEDPTTPPAVTSCSAP